MAGPLPVIADTFRCAFKWQSSAGQTAINVLHFAVPSPGPTGSDVFEAIQDSWTRNMTFVVSNTAVVTEIDVTPLDGVSATFTGATGSPLQFTGSAGGDFVPALACVVKLQTDQRGRSKRGRVYLPFVGEAENVNGTLNSTDIASMQTAWTAFLAAVAVDPTTPMVLTVASYKLASQRAVINALVEGVAATQRRRQSRLR